MILSKVTIQGFKSFAKKTELKFAGNITGVVGPNGCGKTNIVDAIRWGLGEQKTSVLRTDRMENVIFGGAQSSRPLGMADVSVHFDNSSHSLPLDYNEVVITRRLYRSGDSEYLINKNPVRLKDIQDLLMDTGIGTDAYSVIELKMVEDILSDKAEDRKRLLEEAAGVTKYKHRLKAALRKLDATHGDLLRVNDIIQEVERTVRSLQRQVQKARRYKTLHEEIRDLDLKRSSFVYDGLIQKLTPLKKELKGLQSQKDGRTTEIVKEEADLESLRLKLVDNEKILTDLQGKLNNTIDQIRTREGDIRLAKQRIESQEELIARSNQDIVELQKRSEDQKTHLDLTTRNREALQVKITSTGRIFSNKKKELEVFQQSLNLKRLELNKHKKEIIDCLEEINRLSSEETQMRARIDNSQGRLERLDEEDGAFRKALETAGEGKKEWDRKLNDLQSKEQKLVEQKQQITGNLTRQRHELEEGKEQLFRYQSELDIYKGRLAFLKNILESREGITNGGKWLIEQKASGLIGPLADLIEVSAENRTAIEMGLGETARYLLFNTLSSAMQAVNTLEQSGGGKATLICLDRVQPASKNRSRPKMPSGIETIGWADDLISCKPDVRPVFSFLLGDLLVVKDMASARKAMEKMTDSPFRVVTMKGEMVTGWGMVQTGLSGESDEGMIGRRQRITELEDQIKDLEKRISQHKTDLQKNEEKSGKLSAQQVENEKALDELRSRLSETEKEVNKIQFSIERADEGIQKNSEERQNLVAEIEKGKSRLSDFQPQMDALLEKRENIELMTGRIQAEVEKYEEEEKTMESAVHQLNLTVVRLNGEANNMDFDINRSKGLIEEIANTLERRRKEIEEAKEDIQKCQVTIGENEKALVTDFAKKEKQEKERGEKEKIYQNLKLELDEREKEVRQVRRDRDEVSERLHNLEMDISELEHQAGSLTERIKEAYDVNIKQIKPEPDLDFDAMDIEIETLRQKIKNLGPVNLVALEEYDQEKERLDFLTQQRDDLLSAEETLKDTIQKINHTARTRFKEVFQQVRENFKMTFTQFFQGGEADLRLPEGEDPLEAQIEIFARPAGKQLRDLSLLSGGERALTAISLLFALYLVKPSPFCILDEIDAPLDENNVQRFTRVLEQYSQKTQFVIVTHNKVTMKAARSLYGVTMEEEGVSKLVSVEFKDNQ